MKKAVLATLVGMSLAAPVMAQNAPWIKTESDINFDFTGKKSENYELRLKMDAAFRFEVIAREGVKAVVLARIEQLLYENGDWVALQNLDWEKVLEEAYIQVETDKVSGLPRAIVTFGKHDMAFGQAVNQTPIFRDNLLYNLSQEREVIGVTVELPVKFMSVIDSVAMSVYETGFGDFDISNKIGGSIKVSKKVMRLLEAQASALIKEQAGKDELRGSLGFVFTSPNGNYKVWAQGLVFDNNPNLPNTEWGAQIGGSAKAGPGTVVVDYQYLENHAHELVVAYNLPVGSHLMLSPELRQTWDLGGVGADEFRVGVRTRIYYSTEHKRKLKAAPMH